MSKKLKTKGDFWDDFGDFFENFGDNLSDWLDDKFSGDWDYSTSEIQQGGHKVVVQTKKGVTTIKVDGKEVWSDKK